MATASLFPYLRVGNRVLALLCVLALIYKIVILTFVEEIFVRATCATLPLILTHYLPVRRVPFGY